MSKTRSAGTSPRRLALVTGASGGIGADIARVLAARGVDLALTARTGPSLEALADEIAATGRPRPLVFALDLAHPDAPQILVDGLHQSGATVSMLINNAGYGLMGEIDSLDRAEQVGIIDLNVRALVDLTIRLLPDIEAARGHIMNVASIAAFFPGPGMAIYYASKAFVLSFSDALSEEVKRKGVIVSALCPGLTETGFGARARMGEGLTKLSPKMSAMEVAVAGVDGMMAGHRRVVPGLQNRAATILSHFVPKMLSLPIIRSIQMTRLGK